MAIILNIYPWVGNYPRHFIYRRHPRCLGSVSCASPIPGAFRSPWAVSIRSPWASWCDSRIPGAIPTHSNSRYPYPDAAAHTFTSAIIIPRYIRLYFPICIHLSILPLLPIYFHPQHPNPCLVQNLFFPSFNQSSSFHIDPPCTQLFLPIPILVLANHTAPGGARC